MVTCSSLAAWPSSPTCISSRASLHKVCGAVLPAPTPTTLSSYHCFSRIGKHGVRCMQPSRLSSTVSHKRFVRTPRELLAEAKVRDMAGQRKRGFSSGERLRFGPLQSQRFAASIVSVGPQVQQVNALVAVPDRSHSVWLRRFFCDQRPPVSIACSQQSFTQTND